MDKPVIKPFVFDNKCYFYDTYTNRLFGVTSEQYKEIVELLKIGNRKFLDLDKNNEAYNDIKMLLNKGLMKCGFIEKIEHPETYSIKDILNMCMSDLILQVTRDCNFNCRYCLFANDTKISRNHERKKMSWEIAKKSIDFLYKHSSEAEHITICFYGGEPLLNFELIEQAVNYANSLFFTKKVKYIMTINGSLLTKNVLEFITKNNFHVTISLDGPAKIQNIHRRFSNTGLGTFEKVYHNVNFLRINYPDFFNNNISFCPVVIDDEDYEEIATFFKRENISLDRVNPLKANMNGMDYTLSKIGADNSNLKKISFEYDLVNQKSIKDLERIYNDKHVIPSRWHHNGPCIPGQRRLFVDVEGTFYPCEKMIEDSTYVIGDIENGFDCGKITEFLNIGKITEDECKKCWAAHFCQICVTLCNDVDKSKLSKEQKLKACQAQKDVALWYLKRRISELEQKKQNINK